MLREIVKIPNKILRARAKEVPAREIPAHPIQLLISQMKETLKSTPDGVGLAAPQIGESLRIFIVSEEAEEIDKTESHSHSREGIKGEGGEHITSPPACPAGRTPPPSRGGNITKDLKYYVFINPIVKKISKSKLDGPEGCLSVPGKWGEVRRHEKITVEAYDENGKKFTRGASKFFARVLQHELDHLDGTLFIDKAEKIVDIRMHDQSNK